MVLNNRSVKYLYTESDLIKAVAHNKLSFGRNLLHKYIKHFDSKTEETILTKRCKRTSILLRHFWHR